MHQAICLLGAFLCFVMFVLMCYRIHETTKEIEETEAIIKQIEERGQHGKRNLQTPKRRSVKPF